MGLKKTLLAVRDAYRRARYAGIACAAKNTGIGNGLAEYGKVILRPETDGTVTLFHSWTEMGQGCTPCSSQIACEELGLTADRVRVERRHRARARQRPDHGVPRHHARGPGGHRRGRRSCGWSWTAAPSRELAGQEFYGEVQGRLDDHARRPTVAEPVTHFAYGWATQVVVLDDEGRIAKVIAAHDVGKVINPTLLEGQVEGGVHMGLGHALSEEFVVEDGRPGHDDAEVARHHPAVRHAAGGVHLRRGAPARGTVRREGRRRGGAGAHRHGSGRRALRVRGVAEPACR